MALMSPDKILKYLPELFDINLISDKAGETIFRKLEKLLTFDAGYVYFAGQDSLQLKYSYKKYNDYKINSDYTIPQSKRNILFRKNHGVILSNDDVLIKSLNLPVINQNSFLISKLSVKSTVFGIILLTKNEDNFYSQDDVKLLDAVSSIISYVIKDMELSDVFKMQLKALKSGIIEKNEAYKTIKEQNEKILEADKIKNEFLANVSHELRTPLNSILGYADILSAELYGNLNQKQSEYINDIKVSATHLLGMINEILDMSKIEANAMKIVKSNFPISRAITEVSNILMPIAKKKNIKIDTSVNEDFEVFADYQKIQQILYNLTSNAIKYSPENDTVEIAVIKNSQNFRIAVHDNGIGIDKKYHGKIFAKFVQLDSAFTKKESSTGLGLTIAKELTELHGGKISLISEVNNGSTFIVEIPLPNRC